MKKIVLGLTVAALLTGCGTATSPSSEPTDTYTDYAASDTTTSPEDEFLYDVHSVHNSRVDSKDDAWLIESGYTVCETLAAGYTVLDIAAMMSEAGLDSAGNEGVAALVAAAVVNLCPEYQYQLEG